MVNPGFLGRIWSHKKLSLPWFCRPGIMDPDSKSAASWGDATKGLQRQPVEEVALPATIEFGVPTAGR